MTSVRDRRTASGASRRTADGRGRGGRGRQRADRRAGRAPGAARHASWWTPVRIIVLVAIGMFALGMVQKLPCYNGGWFSAPATQYTHACYSDIPHLYHGGASPTDLVPYFDRLPGDMEYLVAL